MYEHMEAPLSGPQALSQNVTFHPISFSRQWIEFERRESETRALKCLPHRGWRRARTSRMRI